MPRPAPYAAALSLPGRRGTPGKKGEMHPRRHSPHVHATYGARLPTACPGRDGGPRRRSRERRTKVALPQREIGRPYPADRWLASEATSTPQQVCVIGLDPRGSRLSAFRTAVQCDRWATGAIAIAVAAVATATTPWGEPTSTGTVAVIACACLGLEIASTHRQQRSRSSAAGETFTILGLALSQLAAYLALAVVEANLQFAVAGVMMSTTYSATVVFLRFGLPIPRQKAQETSLVAHCSQTDLLNLVSALSESHSFRPTLRLNTSAPGHLAAPGQLPERAARTVVVYCPTHVTGADLREFSRLEDEGCEIATLLGFYERYLGRTKVEHGDHLLLNWEPRNHTYTLLRRGLDALVAAVGLLVLALVGPVIALAIKTTSPGPVLFKQTRVGKDGRHFKLVKFRTMKRDAEAQGPAFAAARDPRITGIGHLLRKSRLDELPQVLNIARGEMSLIGPRPERPEFAEKLTNLLPAYAKRTLVRPGITGWAQVNEAYAATPEEHQRKLERDLYYLRHRSLRLDVLCMLKTVAMMLKMGGT